MARLRPFVARARQPKETALRFGLALSGIACLGLTLFVATVPFGSAGPIGSLNARATSSDGGQLDWMFRERRSIRKSSPALPGVAKPEARVPPLLAPLTRYYEGSYGITNPPTRPPTPTDQSGVSTPDSTDPTDPPSPTDSTDPTDPPSPTDPTDPPSPTDPTDPPSPTDPTDPPTDGSENPPTDTPTDPPVMNLVQ